MFESGLAILDIGGGTLRVLLLGIHSILWIKRPAYLAVRIAVSLALFFNAYLVESRMTLIMWADAIGLALFSMVGASARWTMEPRHWWPS
jgi:uncharacterized membrane protein YeiH